MSWTPLWGPSPPDPASTALWLPHRDAGDRGRLARVIVARAAACQAASKGKRRCRVPVGPAWRPAVGAETFCAICTYLATVTRHGINWPGALTQAAQGKPWIPGTT
jgi:hypothetical protein